MGQVLDGRWIWSSQVSQRDTETCSQLTCRHVLPERIRLQTKLTKRCPESNCRHLLIQPDTKSTRFKIKMVAMTYLPAIELGRRRRKLLPEIPGTTARTPEDLEQMRKDRRRTRVPAKEEDEPMSKHLQAGHIVGHHQHLALIAVHVPTGVHQSALRPYSDPTGPFDSTRRSPDLLDIPACTAFHGERSQRRLGL
jgi:hypothetical protein